MVAGGHCTSTSPRRKGSEGDDAFNQARLVSSGNPASVPHGCLTSATEGAEELGLFGIGNRDGIVAERLRA